MNRIQGWFFFGRSDRLAHGIDQLHHIPGPGIAGNERRTFGRVPFGRDFIFFTIPVHIINGNGDDILLPLLQAGKMDAAPLQTGKKNLFENTPGPYQSCRSLRPQP